MPKVEKRKFLYSRVNGSEELIEFYYGYFAGAFWWEEEFKMRNLIFYISDVFAEEKDGRISISIGGKAIPIAKGEFV
jgi:hypothetical protein